MTVTVGTVLRRARQGRSARPGGRDRSRASGSTQGVTLTRAATISLLLDRAGVSGSARVVHALLGGRLLGDRSQLSLVRARSCRVLVVGVPTTGLSTCHTRNGTICEDRFVVRVCK